MDIADKPPNLAQGARPARGLASQGVGPVEPYPSIGRIGVWGDCRAIPPPLTARVPFEVYNPPMRFTQPLRQFLLLLLVAAFLLPGSNWPVRGAESREAAEPVAMTMGDMPCDEAMGTEEMPPKAAQGDPCDQGCCPQTSCDFAACLATGVLPSLAWIPSALPAVSLAFAWHSAAPPARPLETALRPPIA